MFDSCTRLCPGRRRPVGGDLMTFLPMIAIFVVFYFLLIRPQQKKAKETRAMLEALQKGDEVVTAGGIVGKIIEDCPTSTPSVEIAPNVEITVQRSAISQTAAQGHDQEPVNTRTGGRPLARRAQAAPPQAPRRLLAGSPP